MAISSSYVTNYQRLYPIYNPLNHYKVPLNSNKSPFSTPQWCTSHLTSAVRRLNICLEICCDCTKCATCFKKEETGLNTGMGSGRERTMPRVVRKFGSRDLWISLAIFGGYLWWLQWFQDDRTCFCWIYHIQRFSQLHTALLQNF